MSKKLEIGASLRRRQYASEQQQEPGESAWDLPHARYAGGQSQVDAEPANERRPSADHQGNGRHHERQLSSTDWSRKAPEEPALDAEEASDRLGLSPVSERRDAENKVLSSPGLDLMRFVRGLWHRKWLVTLIILSSVVLSLLIVQAMPRQWRATTTLITSNSEAVPQGADAHLPEPQNYMLQTFVDTIRLPTSLDETMQRAGISVMRSTLASAISIQLDNASTLLSISVTWDDPGMAARIASTVAELFLENSSEIRFRRIKERYNEYNAQLREAREDLQRINESLLDYSETNQISSLDNQIAALVDLLTETEASYNANLAKVEALTAAKDRLDAQLEAEPKKVSADSRYHSRLNERLADAQRELREARRQYTERSSKVIGLQHQIETLEQLIAEGVGEGRSDKVYETNPKRDELLLRKQRTEDQLEIVEAEANAQRKTLDESRARLSQLVAAQAGWKALNSQSKDKAQLVDRLTGRLSEIQVAMRQVNSGFSILEEASPPDTPEPSLRKLLIATGIILGVGAALFVALLLEFLDPVMRAARCSEHHRLRADP